ncbi:hypothetical protein [Microbacterium aurantiacum]
MTDIIAWGYPRGLSGLPSMLNLHRSEPSMKAKSQPRFARTGLALPFEAR